MQDFKQTGEKVKEFRLRAKLSQKELEYMIDASPGTVSRIEKGKANPTQESLAKIINALKLTGKEVGILFGSNDVYPVSSVQAVHKITRELRLDKILDATVNDLANELNLLGVSIFIREGNTVYNAAVSSKWHNKTLLKLIPHASIRFFRLDLTKHTNSFLVKCILENQPYFSIMLKHFLRPVYSNKVIGAIQKLTGMKSAIALPLIYDNETIGVVVYGKNYFSTYKDELPFLEAYADNIAAALGNAKKFARLEEELKKLSN